MFKKCTQSENLIVKNVNAKAKIRFTLQTLN